MHNFTQYIDEAREKFQSHTLTDAELSDYIKVITKDASKDILDLLFLIKKYKLLNVDVLDKIRNLSKSNLIKASNVFSIPREDFEIIYTTLSKLKPNELRALPQYQTPQETEGILQKKLRVTDLTIDLDSDKGKRDVIKMYMPMVYKIVNQWVGKSKLTKAELMSAAMLGFNNAINNWKKEETTVSFKTFAAYNIRYQILNDINEYGHTLSGTSWYASEKAKKGEVKLDAASLDSFMNDEGDWTNDHLAALGQEDKEKDDTEHWKTVFNAIEDKFKVRDVDIFYRYFGLNGRKKEKSKDIAKSYGMSEGNIRNSVINKILAYLRSDKKLLSILQDIQDIYNEGLMVELIHMDNRQQIVEALLSDDTFILLEEINRWNKKDVFMNAVKHAIETFKNEDQKIIKELLAGSFDDIDSSYKKNKRVIVTFLTNMYPTETFLRKSDVDIIDRMTELQDAWKKFNK